MNLLHILQSRLHAALGGLVSDPSPYSGMVRSSNDPKFGDFQANCAMPLAKELGRPPRDLAADIVARLDVADFCETPEIAGPGFINFRLREDWLATQINAVADDPRLGVAPVTKPRNIIVDFSSPNVAKPMHVGHLRSTVIGDALTKILTHLGHHVLSDNHIGDWGTQFGMIIYGCKHFLTPDAYSADAVGELARLYRLVNNLCDYQLAKVEAPKLQLALTTKQAELAQLEGAVPSDAKEKKEFDKSLKKLRKELEDLRESTNSTTSKIAAIESNAATLSFAQSHLDIVRLSREETAKLHAGDAENRRLWNEFLPKCVAALQTIYTRLSIHFDMTLGESFYDPFLADVVADLKAKGIATESDGAMCVFIEGNAAPFLVQKADGAYNYATTDLATIKYRVDELNAEEILYVVDHRQSEHFDLLFATIDKWGYRSQQGEPLKLSHVKFGTVMGKDGKPFKTRSGDTVGLESLLDEAIAKARQIVAENDDRKTDNDGNPTPELPEAERDAIAEVVGLGGIKYADLKHNRESDYIFDTDKMLAMTGDTATYLQYAYARLCGIFRKGGVDRADFSSQPATIQLTHPAERALALQLLRFEEALTHTAAEAKPNLLTQYLYDLAGHLTTFYEGCPVLKGDDPEVRTSRLHLVNLTGRVIEQGLALLGIGVCEKM
ncbi:MAG: arginine--tRNA ligase [Planctomycetaceae bacterium]